MTKRAMAPCFNCHHLINKMMLLMMQLASHGRNAGTNGIKRVNPKVMFHLIIIIVT